MIRNMSFTLVLLALISCRTSSKSTTSDIGSSGSETALWDQYFAEDLGTDKIQKDCMPRIIRADASVPRKGLLMFFHGFTACPQQYFAIGDQLSKQGFDVYLPLLPGQGREPFDGPKGDKDNFMPLPSWDFYNNKEGRWEDANGDKIDDRLIRFVEVMNEVARRAPSGTKVLAGLSGGGGLATGAAIQGTDIWDRVLLYAPYYKNPGVNETASQFLNWVSPNYTSDWGKSCRANRARDNGRAGLCELTMGAIRAMTDYGAAQAKNVDQIKAPVQVVGVVYDKTADVGAIVHTYARMKNARLCLYPNGVPHSIINPASDAPELFGKVVSQDPDSPKDRYADLKSWYWVAPMQEDSIAFITEGRFFPSGKQSEEKYEVPVPYCRYK